MTGIIWHNHQPKYRYRWSNKARFSWTPYYPARNFPLIREGASSSRLRITKKTSTVHWPRKFLSLFSASRCQPHAVSTLCGSIGESDLSEWEVRQEFLVGIGGACNTEGWTRRLFLGEDTLYLQLCVCVNKFVSAISP